jgi:hypothetical protein
VLIRRRFVRVVFNRGRPRHLRDAAGDTRAWLEQTLAGPPPLPPLDLACGSWAAARPLQPASYLALRQRRLAYSNDDALEAHGDALGAAGLLLDSLELPGLPDERRSAGRKVVRSWVGHATTVPLRCLVARA